MLPSHHPSLFFASHSLSFGFSRTRADTQAFISYMKSIYLQKDKNTFDLSQYPAEEFAASMGLPGAPQITFGNGQKAKEKKRGGDEVVVEVEDVGRDVVASDDEESDEEEEEEVVGEVSGSEEESEGDEGVSESEEEDEPTVSLSLDNLGVWKLTYSQKHQLSVRSTIVCLNVKINRSSHLITLL